MLLRDALEVPRELVENKEEEEVNREGELGEDEEGECRKRGRETETTAPDATTVAPAVESVVHLFTSCPNITLMRARHLHPPLSEWKNWFDPSLIEFYELIVSTPTRTGVIIKQKVTT